MSAGHTFRDRGPLSTAWPARRSAWPLLAAGVLLAAIFSAHLAAAPAEVMPQRPTLNASDFGAAGDGLTDDGPAISRMLEAARRHPNARLQFAPNRTYFIRTAPSRYAFDLSGVSELVLDGGGSTFELGPHVRFLRLRDSRKVTVRRLRVDFRPLPFADGTVVAVNGRTRSLDVRLADGPDTAVCGGPTHEDGEQAFFGMLWTDGPYGTVSRHYWLDRVEPGGSAGVVRAYASKEFTEFGDLEPGRWKISLPVPGIAHRYGPGACFSIRDNDTVTFEDVELWSAPWMGFEIARNTGVLTFRRVHVRPKPGSGRLMSTCRDGFHVKGNRARLLWDGCILAGMTDDAFNISTHSSVVARVLAPNRIEVRQKFPLLFIPWRIGSSLAAADERSRRLLGRSVVTHVETGPEPPPIQGEPAAPVSVLTLRQPIPGLTAGSMVWDASSANPDTTLRNCRIAMSCRLQSPVTLEHCDVTALLWFYAEGVEGPFPGPITVRDCTLRRGRGNPVYAVVCSGASELPDAAAQAPPRAIHGVRFERNRIYGGFSIEGAEDVTLTGNRFLETGAPIVVKHNHGLRTSANTDTKGPLPLP
jgi:hypothetical protein